MQIPSLLVTGFREVRKPYARLAPHALILLSARVFLELPAGKGHSPI
jgi:hypothetical protein